MPLKISYKGTKSLKASWKRVVGNQIFSNKQGSKHKFEVKAREREQTLKIINPSRRHANLEKQSKMCKNLDLQS